MNLSTKAILFVFTLLFSSFSYAQQTYYIASSGSDSNKGTSESSPWKSISKVNGFNFKPGDRVLFRRGDSWNTELRPNTNGASGKLITFSAYGSGKKPVISAPSGAYSVNIRGKSYVRIDGLYVITPPDMNGIAIRGNSVGNEVINCTVEGRGSAGKGIVFSSPLNGEVASRSRIANNEVFKTAYGIDGSYGMHGGGIIENNYIHDIRDGGGDGIVARRGNYNGLIIRDNEITGWRDDAIDCYGGNNITIEFNYIHHVAAKVNTAGNGIKSGGGNTVSSHTIVRYNIIHSLRGNSGGSKDGINANGGDDSEIYGNLIYDVQGEALSIPKDSRNIKIHHNTLVSDNRALFVGSTSGISVSNNIFWGSRGALNINMRISGKSNLFIGGVKSDNYTGSGDVIASSSAVFANPSQNDYRLKSGSPAIDKGASISGYSTSIEKKSIKGAPDIGAYEYGGSSTPPPSSDNLTVDAGRDNSLVLPTNSISLQASVSGSGDARVSYQWAKKSGPSATLKDASSSKLVVQNMREGTYVFSVTASANQQSATDEVQVVVKSTPNDSPPTPPSPPSGSNGLRYKYYEGSWKVLPNFASQTVRKQGTVSNFTLGVRQREENFGIVFTGSIQINTSGSYTFYTNSDDGSKLYIDGKQVVNNDECHAPRERSGKISLSRGRHAIEVRFFERTRGQVLDVRYAGPGVSKRAIPDNVLFPDDGGEAPQDDPAPAPPTAGKNGLRYQYYEGEWRALPDFGKLKAIKSGTLSNFSLSPARDHRYFGLVYTGYIRIDQQGSYTFYTASDDGSKLYINGKQIVDNDGVHPVEERSGKVSLSAGYHRIEVRFFERTYGDELSVRYQGPGVSKRAVPSSVLYLEKPSNARTATASHDTATEEKPSSKETIVPAQEIGSEAIVYPVPLAEELTIDLGKEGTDQAVDVTLTDRMGRTILEKSLTPYQRRRLVLYIGDVELLTGVYFVNVATREGSLSTFKVIKK